MADGNKGGSGISPNSAIIAALLATGAIWFSRPAPLEPSRPAPLETHVEARFDDQDVEARLWQDPLEAIAKRVEKADAGPQKECAGRKGDADPNAGRHCRSPLFDAQGKPVGDASKTMILGVVAPGAPYFEDSETRRRLRYAVLSGLHSENFFPLDDQHVGYFRPFDNERRGLPAAIPYEALRKDATNESILLFWIDEDIFKGAGARSGGALRRLATLGEALCPESKCPTPPKFSVLGPYTSDAQENFGGVNGDFTICEADDGRPSVRKPARALSVNFYSYSVTGGESKLILPPCRVGRPIKLNFVRTIAGDQLLAKEIANEMQRRGFRFQADAAQGLSRDSLPHIAMISDLDTLYGRTVVEVFEKTFNALACPDADREARKCSPIFERIHSRAYLRGLDGMLPVKDDHDKKDKNQPKNQMEASGAPQEEAFGAGQFDYLRRLAASLKSKDDELWRRNQTHIEAIGILGNDVFDKLLVLRALRPLFPEAIFFTTDFDQALAGPKELEWTRNLLIASSYGPTLSPYWQGRVPPFRGVYQTSAFLAARLAADEIKAEKSEKRLRIADATSHARLFEIQRSGEFLSLPVDCMDQSNAEEKARAMIVQPEAQALYPQFAHRTRADVFVILILSGVALIGIWARKLLWPYLTTTWIGLAFCLFTAAGVAWFWNDLGVWATDSGLGEPVAGLDGVSVWPTIAIRAFGAVIALCLMVDAWFGLQRNLLTTVRKETLFLHLPAAAPNCAAMTEAGADIVRVGPVWAAYVRQSGLKPVATVVAVCVVASLGFYAGLCVIWGWPNVPWRGAHSEIYYTLTYVCIVAMLALTFLVVYATVLCLRFVIVLRDHRTCWMPATRQHYVEKLGWEDELVDDWIDLSFMAARTKCIGGLIYMPFALSVLLTVSRSTIFASFAPNAPILITQSLALAVLFACAMGLCLSAEKARSLAKAKISARILQIARTPEAKDAPKGAPAPNKDQLEGLQKMVEDLHEGSFVPLSQQPPIRALLLPLGGFGWTALLDYRLLPGL